MNLVSGKNIASIERPAIPAFTEPHPTWLKTVHTPAGPDYMMNGWKPVLCVRFTFVLTNTEMLTGVQFHCVGN